MATLENSLRAPDQSRSALLSEANSDAWILWASRHFSAKSVSTKIEMGILKAAYSAGIPTFTAGVFHLRDLLARYAVNDSEATTLFETVSSVAKRVDPDQLFTVIRYPLT